MAPQIATTFDDDSAARYEGYPAFRPALSAGARSRAFVIKCARAPSTTFSPSPVSSGSFVDRLGTYSSESLSRITLDGLELLHESYAACLLDSPIVLDAASFATKIADPRPSEELFESLAKRSPDRLLEYLSPGNLPLADLAFATEATGLIDDPTRAIPCLLALLKHVYAPVREASVYALARHAGSYEEIRSALRTTAESDPSLGVKEAASEALAL